MNSSLKLSGAHSKGKRKHLALISISIIKMTRFVLTQHLATDHFLVRVHYLFEIECESIGHRVILAYFFLPKTILHFITITISSCYQFYMPLFWHGPCIGSENYGYRKPISNCWCNMNPPSSFGYAYDPSAMGSNEGDKLVGSSVAATEAEFKTVYEGTKVKDSIRYIFKL